MIKDHAKLWLGAIVYPLQTRRWRCYVKGNPVLSHLARQHPKILHKIYRPYLDARLSCANRVDMLIAHYDWMFQAGLAEWVAQAATTPVPVAEFAGKNGACFTLHLTAISDGHREGELMLKLLHERNCVYSSSFVLVNSHSTPSIAIGSLQGLRALDGAQVIKSVTRELHGCRPKKLMAAAVRTVGECLGCTNMLLISNRNLVTVNGRRASRISSNYDATWQEMGALRGQDGNFHLQCNAVQDNVTAVASNKRAEARRRNALLASVSDSIRAGMARQMGWTPAPAAVRTAATLPQVSGKDAPSSNDPRIDLLIG